MDTSIKVKTIHLRFHDPADVRSLSQREHGSVDPQEGVADGNMLRRKDEGRLQSGPVGHNADTSAPAQQRDASKLAVRRRVVPSRRAGRLSSSGMSVTTKSSPQVPRRVRLLLSPSSGQKPKSSSRDEMTAGTTIPTVPVAQRRPCKRGTESICCDRCGRWYHLDCLGIGPDDPRVVGLFVPFFCAMCSDEDRDLRQAECPVDPCKCALDTCQGAIEPEDEFVVECILGRHLPPLEHGVPLHDEKFLVKWKTYPLGVSTWETRDDIGSLSNAFIARFWKRAEAEGLCDRTAGTVLLQKAVGAGFS